jgi:oxidase EvaA
MSALAGVQAWRAAQRERAAFACTPRPLGELAAWTVGEDAIRHASGGFFQVVAVRCRSSLAALDGLAQPFILQPEIGILGFLATPGARGPLLLVQAKTEPGNAGAVQLAPSFQCTPSNYTARHGGTPAPFLALFAEAPPPGAVRRSDAVNSEQGTRFLGKFNRNMVVELPQEAAPRPGEGAWRWIEAAELLPLLGQDNLVNTDARSVLVGTPWAWLCGGAPFARRREDGGFGAALHAAHARGEAGAEHPLGAVLAWLAAHRRAVEVRHDRLALAALPGWALGREAWAPLAPGGFAVRGYAVQARDREVAQWQQPLVDSDGIGQVVLLCQRRRGVLHVLLHACAEAGLANVVEFGATLQVAPGAAPSGAEAALADLATGAAVRLRCRQSEEGGRFHCDENDYVVAEIDEGAAVEAGAGRIWVGIAQLEALCARPGLTTNELRSTAALLLSLAV